MTWLATTRQLEGVVTAPSSTVGRVTVGFELRDEDASACLLRAQTFMSQIINSLQANETLVRAPCYNKPKKNFISGSGKLDSLMPGLLRTRRV